MIIYFHHCTHIKALKYEKHYENGHLDETLNPDQFRVLLYYLSRSFFCPFLFPIVSYFPKLVEMR